MSNLIISGGVTLSGGFSAEMGAGGGGGVSSLTVTSGLDMWFKADSLNLSNGASVSSWADQQGGGSFTAVQNNPTWPDVPTYVSSAINGKPAVRNSGYSLMKRSGGFATSFTFFMVLKDAVATQQDTYPISVGGTWYDWNSRAIIGLDNGTLLFKGTGWYSPKYGGSAFAAPGTSDAYIIAVTLTSNSGAVGYYNGSQVFTVSNGNAGQGTNDSIALFDPAVSGSPFSYKGDIAEFIVYNQVLSGTDITAVHSYLGTKYGISV